MECIFCKMKNGDIKTEILAQNADFFAICDISPKAKVHILLISKMHKSNFVEFFEDREVKNLVEIIRKLIADNEIADSGYKLITNSGSDGGQSVDHFHIHLVGGELLKWPV